MERACRDRQCSLQTRPEDKKLKTKDKLAVHELLSRAAYYFDVRNEDGLAACFADDCPMRVNIGEDVQLGPFEGRDAIMDLMRGSWDAQNDVRRHIICDIFFESTGADEATVVSTLVVSSVKGEEMSLETSGVYCDRVKKVGAEWQFAERQLDLDKGF
jgi:hypothetical protein